MTTKRRISGGAEYCQLAHFNLLDELDSVLLADSCCQICHCDCFSSHKSIDQSSDDRKPKKHLKKHTKDSNNNNDSFQTNLKRIVTNRISNKKVKRKSDLSEQFLERRKFIIKTPTLATTTYKSTELVRSKSVGSLLGIKPVGSTSNSHFIRDCEQLQCLITSLHTPRLRVNCHESNLHEIQPLQIAASKSSFECRSTSNSLGKNSTWLRPNICESLANLCLTPSVREAYEKVSTHDKKILNRMANKRGERIIAKENAWLARKLWENERYQRELVKWEQMTEHKRAVREKQFQDFISTKERLNELAHRDFEELQRLRSNLAKKDALTKKRLDTVRIERDILLCQRRCEELNKSEAVNLQQEEQNLGDALRRKEICGRLTYRLHRADEIRNEQLEGYLKRLRYDNLIEQLVHQEHWQTVQKQEKMKQTQLKEHIEAKVRNTQRFLEQRQRRIEALSKTAKISANLREFVRSSVIPEASTGLGNAEIASYLGKLLFDP